MPDSRMEDNGKCKAQCIFCNQWCTMRDRDFKLLFEHSATCKHNPDNKKADTKRKEAGAHSLAAFFGEPVKKKKFTPTVEADANAENAPSDVQVVLQGLQIDLPLVVAPHIAQPRLAAGSQQTCCGVFPKQLQSVITVDPALAEQLRLFLGGESAVVKHIGVELLMKTFVELEEQSVTLCVQKHCEWGGHM